MKAVKDKHRSLFAAGIVKAQGDFEAMVCIEYWIFNPKINLAACKAHSVHH